MIKETVVAESISGDKFATNATKFSIQCIYRACANIVVIFETRDIGQTLSSLERYLVRFKQLIK